jgi:hypothetical protein
MHLIPSAMAKNDQEFLNSFLDSDMTCLRRAALLRHPEFGQRLEKIYMRCTYDTRSEIDACRWSARQRVEDTCLIRPWCGPLRKILGAR